MSSAPVGRRLAAVLAAAGVGAVYGRPVRGLAVTEVADPATAVVLAAAHRAVHGVPAAAHTGDGRLVVDGPAGPSGPGGPGALIDAADPADLAAAAPAVAVAADGAGAVLRVDLDAGLPSAAGPLAVPPVGDPWPEPGPQLLQAVRRAGTVVVLAGPGVVHRRAVGGLRALAAAGRLGVCNTWGAKGVFPWQSRHHWATVGLQADDLRLGGLADAGLVLAVGVDEREAPPEQWAGHPHRVVAPEALGPLAEAWPVASPGPVPPMPPLRDRLAAVTQAGWASAAVPMPPSLVTRHYAAVLGGSGLVAADAGTAGLWVARTFPTAVLGSALVPPAPVAGWAAACVVAARLAAPLRPALAVVDGPVDGATAAVVEAAARLGVTVGVEAWDPDGDGLGPDAHLGRLRELADPSAGGGAATLATGTAQLQELVAAAGPVQAWGGLRA